MNAGAFQKKIMSVTLETSHPEMSWLKEDVSKIIPMFGLNIARRTYNLQSYCSSHVGDTRDVPSRDDVLVEGVYEFVLKSNIDANFLKAFLFYSVYRFSNNKMIPLTKE